MDIYYIGNLIEKYLHRGRFQRMITNVLDMNNQVFVGIGGSDDFVYYYIKFLYERIFKEKLVEDKDKKIKTISEDIAIVHFDSKIDLFGTMDAVTSINYFKKIYKILKESGFKSKIVFVGIQSIFCPSQILDEIDAEADVQTQIYWIRKNIRTVKLDTEQNTQTGTIFTEILNNLQTDGFTNIEVSFDMCCLKSEFAPGRSDICTADGLTPDEAIDISKIAGANPLVKSFIITEFNPGVETKKTGKVLMDMFHNFIIGSTQRQQEN